MRADVRAACPAGPGSSSARWCGTSTRIYLNFISGFELALGTAQALRQGFRGPIYADLHSLFLGMQHDGMRVLQPLADAGGLVRLLRRGPAQRGRDAPALAGPAVALSAQALGAGMSLLVVTLGPEGRGVCGGAGVRRVARGRTGERGGEGPCRRGRPASVRPWPPTATRRRPPSAAIRTALDSRAPGRGPRPHRLRRRVRRRRVRPAARRRPASRPRCAHATAMAARNAGLPRSRRPEPPPPRGAAGAVTRVIEVPATFDDRSFEQFAAGVRRAGRRRRRSCSMPAARSGPRRSACSPC